MAEACWRWYSRCERMICFLNSALLSCKNKFCTIFIFPVICFLAFFLSINNDVFFRWKIRKLRDYWENFLDIVIWRCKRFSAQTMIYRRYECTVSYKLEINSIYSLNIQVVTLLHKLVDVPCYSSILRFFLLFSRVFVGSRNAVRHVDQFGQDSLYPVGFVLGAK